MLMLVTGLILFLGIHLLPTLPGLRFALVQHWGEQRYKGAFSLVALAGLALIVGGYAAAAPGARLFQPSPSAIVLAPYAITLSFVLLAAANLRGHIRRVLKHPMLIAIAIGAAVHYLPTATRKAGSCSRAFSPMRSSTSSPQCSAMQPDFLHPAHGTTRWPSPPESLRRSR